MLTVTGSVHGRAEDSRAVCSSCGWELEGPASDLFREAVEQHAASHRSPFGPVLAGLAERERGSLAADVGTLLGFVAVGWLAVVLWSAVLA